MKTIKVEFQCHHVEDRKVINDALGEYLKSKAMGTLCPHCEVCWDNEHQDNADES